MLLLSIGTGVVAWFIFMVFLRRLLLQPELVRLAKIWFGITVILIASSFALASMFAFSVFDLRFFDLNVFSIAFFLFLVLAIFTSLQCARMALR